MEIYIGAIGAIAAVFVVIFGGRGLVDLVRGYPERRRAPLAAADDSPSPEQPAGASVATNGPRRMSPDFGGCVGKHLIIDVVISNHSPIRAIMFTY